MKQCPIHPTYRAIRRPTSKRTGCICREIWQERKGAKP